MEDNYKPQILEIQESIWNGKRIDKYGTGLDAII